MKIVNVETFLVPPRWLFCRVETDEGVVGWGEPVVEGRAEAVRATVHVLAEYLMGQDPLRIEDHWQVMANGGFYRGGPVLSSALAGLDQALWDIAGKTYGVPVHALLGGHVRDRVRMYAWVGGDEPAELAESIGARIEAGFSAVKMNASGRMPALATVADVAGVVERVALAREILGPGRDVAVDFHGRVSAADARRILPLIAEFQPLFAEEPVLPDRPHLLRDVVTSSARPGRHRRAALLALGFPARARGRGGGGAARPVTRGRDLGDPEDRRARGGCGTPLRPALPARPPRPRCQPPGRLRDSRTS